MTHSLPAAEVSVIVPVFNEEQVMPLLVDRLRSLQRALAPRRVQVLLIGPARRPVSSASTSAATSGTRRQ
jgi:hypothetical protein